MLQQKLFPNAIFPNYNNLQEIKCLLNDQEKIVENKLTFLNKELNGVYELTRSKVEQSSMNSQIMEEEKPYRESFTSEMSMISFYENQSTLSSSKNYLKNHEDRMSRLKKRKQKMKL